MDSIKLMNGKLLLQYDYDGIRPHLCAMMLREEAGGGAISAAMRNVLIGARSPRGIVMTLSHHILLVLMGAT